MDISSNVKVRAYVDNGGFIVLGFMRKDNSEQMFLSVHDGKFYATYRDLSGNWHNYTIS